MGRSGVGPQKKRSGRPALARRTLRARGLRRTRRPKIIANGGRPCPCQRTLIRVRRARWACDTHAGEGRDAAPESSLPGDPRTRWSNRRKLRRSLEARRRQRARSRSCGYHHPINFPWMPSVVGFRPIELRFSRRTTTVSRLARFGFPGRFAIVTLESVESGHASRVNRPENPEQLTIPVGTTAGRARNKRGRSYRSAHTPCPWVAPLGPCYRRAALPLLMGLFCEAAGPILPANHASAVGTVERSRRLGRGDIRSSSLGAIPGPVPDRRLAFAACPRRGSAQHGRIAFAPRLRREASHHRLKVGSQQRLRGSCVCIAVPARSGHVVPRRIAGGYLETNFGCTSLSRWKTSNSEIGPIALGISIRDSLPRAMPLNQGSSVGNVIGITRNGGQRQGARTMAGRRLNHSINPGVRTLGA
jgi:hypothetical protein